jgi:hypothetical protein
VPLHWSPAAVLNSKMKDACSDTELIACAQNATYSPPQHINCYSLPHTTAGFAYCFTLMMQILPQV